jgi:hypothetical protein
LDSKRSDSTGYVVDFYKIQVYCNEPKTLQMYIATKENDFMLGLDPISIWKTRSKFDSALRHLAILIFKIK